MTEERATSTGRPITPEERTQMAEIAAYEQDLATQSDRGAAILAFCDMEDTLEAIIRAQLHDAKEQKGETIQDRMFRGYGPLASFSAKRRLAFMIGIIDHTYYKDLAILATIRNKFAHKTYIRGFKDNSIKQDCNKLKSIEFFGGTITINGQDINLTDTPRKQFLFTCRHISQSLRAMEQYYALRGNVGPREPVFLKPPTSQ